MESSFSKMSMFFCKVLKNFVWFSMLVTACNKSWDNESILLFFVDCSHCIQIFIGAIVASNLKETKLLAGGVLRGMTVVFGKESRDGV